MADKKGLQKIGLQIPKIVLKAAGNDPKRLKKIRDLFGKKKQLKFPGMKIGGDAKLKNKDRLTESDIKKAKTMIKSPRDKALDVSKKTMAILKGARDFHSAYKRDEAKVQKKMGGGVAKTAGAQSALGRLEKSGMKMNKGGDAKIKKVISGLHKASALHKGQAKSLESVVKKSTGGMADYYKDII